MVFEYTTTPTGKKLEALVVDDDPMIRRIHKMVLTRLGFETQTVENGQKAVDLFHSGANFILTLMDMEMPVMDGPEATKALRSMGVNSLIVGVTSRNLDSEKQEFMDAGLNDCLVKPMNVDKIKTLVQQISQN